MSGKDAVSIPDGVVEIFHLHNHCGSTAIPESFQPQKKWVRDIFSWW